MGGQPANFGPMRRSSLLALLVLAVVLSPVAATGAPAEVEPAWGGLDAPLRPGDSMGHCTLNFLFYDSVVDLEAGEAPTGYMGTAAHCTDRVGETVVAEGYGAIGKVVYDSDVTPGADDLVDFALIELDPEVIADANPTVRTWGGPVGHVRADDLRRGDIVDLHGYGMIVGDRPLTRDRQGVVVNWTADEYVVDMPAVNGDSGGPLIHDRTGQALGIVSRYGFAAMPPSTDTGPLLTFIFDELATAGFGDVVLATV